MDGASRFLRWTPDRVMALRGAQSGMTSACTAVVLVILVGGRADALDWRVRIVNETQHAMIGFYGVNVDESGWGGSRLGADILPAGASVVIDFDDGGGYCRFRFRAVFDDSVELVRPSVNVCEVGTYRYTD